MSKTWQHDELARDLADSLTLPERMIWVDMQLGPSGSPRPDVFTMRKSYTRPLPISYEIKVSVSDFRSDVTSGKWQKYLAFSSAVIFAVPRGLITKDDLPAGCGLMTRSENGWTTARKPTHNPVQLPQHVMLKLLIDGIERARRPRPDEWNQYLSQKQLKARFGKDVMTAVNDLSSARSELSTVQAKVDAKMKLADANAERIIEEAKQFREKHLSVFGDICRALQIPPTTQLWKIRERLSELEKIIDECKLTKAYRESLIHMKANIERALLEIPAVNNEDAA